MAHEHDCAIWVPTQGTKDSMNSPDVVRMDQASGSAKKVHVAQLIISIARAIGDIDKSLAVVSILKNRSGKSGKIFNNVKFNNGTCTITCDDIVEYDDLAWEENADKRKTDDSSKKISSLLEKNRNAYQQSAASKQTDSKHIVGNYIGVVPNRGDEDTPF